MVIMAVENVESFQCLKIIKTTSVLYIKES